MCRRRAMKTFLLRRAVRWTFWLVLVPTAPASPAMAAGCSVSTSGIAFGSYNPLLAAALDSAGDLAVSCSAPTAYSLALGTGTGTGTGSHAGRQLSGGRGVGLVYDLFLDASRSTVWGDGSSASAVVSGVAPEGGAVARHTVYGRIPARQNLPAGIYSDSVSILVSY
jgi:spore coat protein U-like protein